MFRWEIAAAIVQTRVVAIVRTDSAGGAVSAGRAILAGGLPVLEVALTTPGGVDAIRTLVAEAPPTALIGAGTVLDAETARTAVLAGARFLVSPGLFPDVIRMGHRYGVPVIPGAATPTEIVAALEAGADLVKLFPAEQLGVAFLRAVCSAIPQAPLVPTGGVGARNAREWLGAGAVALGVGGALTNGESAAVTQRARELWEAVRQ